MTSNHGAPYKVLAGEFKVVFYFEWFAAQINCADYVEGAKKTGSEFESTLPFTGLWLLRILLLIVRSPSNRPFTQIRINGGFPRDIVMII